MSEAMKRMNLADEAFDLATQALEDERPADAYRHLGAAADELATAETHGGMTDREQAMWGGRMLAVVRLLAEAGREEALLAPW